MQVSVQGLVEAFVLALGGGFVGFARYRFDAFGFEELHEGPGAAAAGGIQCRAVVGKELLRCSVAFDGLGNDGDCGGAGFAGCDQGRQRQTRMIIDELEDGYLLAAGELPFGRVDLPARVGLRIDEPFVGASRLLPRFGHHDTGPGKDPGHGGTRGRCEALS
ncbi:hypothetical protein AYX19_01160 [Paenarthrobacter ureafaciens]|nr:hypothetical protein AYX19_01160 [Paenarthrobacter ureafaciens]